MKRILILVAVSSLLCSTGSAFQGGSGESTKKGSSKKTAPTKRSRAGEAKQTASPATKSNLPNWMTQLSNNPILPGKALAGIHIGYSEETVVRALGPTEPFPVTSEEGEVLFYALTYLYRGVFLGIYTLPDTRKVFRLRLYDDNFNTQAYIPRTDKGVTIGISASLLQQILGKPAKTDEHFTCPQSLDPERRAKTFHYVGVSFWVCDVNSLVYLIDIPY